MTEMRRASKRDLSRRDWSTKDSQIPRLESLLKLPIFYTLPQQPRRHPLLSLASTSSRWTGSSNRLTFVKADPRRSTRSRSAVDRERGRRREGELGRFSRSLDHSFLVLVHTLLSSNQLLCISTLQRLRLRGKHLVGRGQERWKVGG